MRILMIIKVRTRILLQIVRIARYVPIRREWSNPCADPFGFLTRARGCPAAILFNAARMRRASFFWRFRNSFCGTAGEMHSHRSNSSLPGRVKLL